jgi:hypothetical protein
MRPSLRRRPCVSVFATVYGEVIEQPAGETFLHAWSVVWCATALDLRSLPKLRREAKSRATAPGRYGVILG